MHKVLFVCHGNICRSPMAEFIFRKLVRDARLDGLVSVESCATSREEIGCDVYPPAKAELFRRGIPMEKRRARQFTASDYENNDYIVCMDDMNVRNLLRMTGGDPAGKVSRLMDHTSKPGVVDDPWYTDRFSEVFDQIYFGCQMLLDEIRKEI